MNNNMGEVMYRFHCDPGHGWLEVPVSDLRSLGIEGRITTFSFIKRGIAFLEEDLDAETFVKAFGTKYGREPVMKTVYYKDEAPIRGYRHFSD